MRLLTVGSLPPEWGGSARGGVAAFHAALLEGFAKRQSEVEVVGVVPPAALASDLALPVFVRPDRVGLEEFYKSLLRELDPDVVLMNHIANTIGAAHVSLPDPPPAVGIAHSWHSITFRQGDARRRARLLTEEVLAGLSGLVCPSQHCRDDGERLGLRYPRRTEVIHHPLQPIFQQDGIDVSSGERSGVLYVGSLIKRKNPADLVRGAALMPGVDFTLVGEGEEEGCLLEVIDQLDLAGRVDLTSLSGSDHLTMLRDLFLRSSAFCLPSESESFGLVFIEALACGAPVVGFGPAVREIRDILGIEIGVPLDVVSPEAIAAALEDVLSTDWDRGQLRSATIDAFDLLRTTDRYLDLLRRTTLS